MPSKRQRKSKSSSSAPLHLERRADKSTRSELKRHGFRVTKRGVIVDGPRDRKREPIPGARVKVMRGGVVQTSVGRRRDYIYGMTKKEKKEFAVDPELFVIKKLRELRERIPNLKRARKPQVRLQWGAYQATKDFAANRYKARGGSDLLEPSPEEIRRHGKQNAAPLIDALTGLHFVVFVPQKKKRGKRGRKKK